MPNSNWDSLKSRPLDLFYFVFLLTHFYFSAFIDMQPFYPPWLLQFFPKFLLDMPDTWLAMSNDPLARSLQPGYHGRINEFTWFWSLAVFMEGFFQIPSTLIAAIGLWKNVQSTWILILAYGATAAASTIPCIATIWFAPPPGTILSDPTLVSLTDHHKNVIIGSYGVFLFVPLFMAVDAALRLKALVDAKESVSPTIGANDVKTIKTD